MAQWREDARWRVPSGGQSNQSRVPRRLDTVGYPAMEQSSVGRVFCCEGAPNGSLPFALASGSRRPHLRDMRSHELLRQVLETTSPKQVSADLGLSLSMIYKWAEPPDEASGSGASNPLDRIEALIKSTNDLRLVHWIAQKAGGFFIRNPKTHHAHPDFLIPATNEIVQEFADLLAVIATAAADNHITPEEAKKIRQRWEELKTVTECFVHCCEEGNFRPLKDKLPTAAK